MKYIIEPPWFKIKPHLADKKEYIVGNGHTSIKLLDDDVLTETPEGDGKYTSHVGMCITNIQIPKEDLIEQFETVDLQMLY